MADHKNSPPLIMVTLDLENVTWGALRKFVALARGYADEQEVGLDWGQHGQDLTGLIVWLDPSEIAPGEGSL